MSLNTSQTLNDNEEKETLKVEMTFKDEERELILKTPAPKSRLSKSKGNKENEGLMRAKTYDDPRMYRDNVKTIFDYEHKGEIKPIKKQQNPLYAISDLDGLKINLLDKEFKFIEVNDQES